MRSPVWSASHLEILFVTRRWTHGSESFGGTEMKSHTYMAALVGVLAGIAVGVAGVGAARVAARHQ